MALPALIYCAGGNPTFRHIASAHGWLNGARLPDTVYGPDLYFADQEYKKPDRRRYMEAVAKHRPTVATALDWERPEQEREVFAWSEELSALVEAVVIIPKVAGTIDRIPERFGKARVILGYSVPTTYGGTTVPVWEFGVRPVHLLGGSPQKQMGLYCYLNVVSADGNMAHQQAHKCRFWSEAKTDKGHWTQLSKAGDFRTENVNAECFRRSCANIQVAWRRHAAEAWRLRDHVSKLAALADGRTLWDD